MKDKLTLLKKDIDKYLPYLQKKYTMTKLISQSLDDLFEMNANDELLKSWYNSLNIFIKDIKLEIDHLKIKLK